MKASADIPPSSTQGRPSSCDSPMYTGSPSQAGGLNRLNGSTQTAWSVLPDTGSTGDSSSSLQMMTSQDDWGNDQSVSTFVWSRAG